MYDETSIQRQLHREKTFVPPYCPRPTCKHHLGGKNFWQRDGTKKIKRFPYVSQRFRCKDCDKTFAYSFFYLEYRAHVFGKNEKIFEDHRHNISICESARNIGHTERMVRGRIKKMSRWGLLIHAKFTEHLKVEEPIIYDGLENFSYSQYDPNNINQAMGGDSYFVYDFNFCPLNRKGCMTDAQKIKKVRIEKIHGKYPTDGLRTSTKRIFDRLLLKTNGKLILHTDEHFQYRKVVELDIKDTKIKHFKTSSKAVRNFENPLHPVNYLDLQIRQENAHFRRETIAISRHSIAMMESYFLYILFRNYMRPKFLDGPESKFSPAQKLGLTEKILSFKDFFRRRVLPTQVTLNEDWKNLYHRVDPLSRRPIKMAA